MTTYYDSRNFVENFGVDPSKSSGSQQVRPRFDGNARSTWVYNAGKPNDHHHESKNINGVELTLVNIGSVARDHLALERTYLAYVRTSLGIASAGVALMQFLRLGADTRSFAAPIGALVLLAGLLVLCFGTRRFFIVQRTLVSGHFPPSIFEIVFTSVALGSLVVGIFGAIIAAQLR
ncbi:hypothetical protein HYPSUDRAFT_39886 [Hypholoma sublateritium FD-334 SS-4]|uniref:DUF202 domain-containing protein n=1 Tax=Hypholoma sublateritium (strain FD-334 SS-4) TaxID=945553 RepID=A0A0D2PUY6_HYPSF|nr:hypothetical protein HYPSUDRAFT_39886 [Hypholoma sublateritium FD-334 SS-4]